MKEELVSVIIPVYNAEEHLKKCVNSLLEQTHKNIEIILIDDGSTDNSSNICDEFANMDSRIKVIHKENEGVSVARNIGIDNAEGKYVTFVDADDYVEDEYIDVLYELCESNASNIGICGTINEDANGNIISLTSSMQGNLDGKAALKLMLTKKYFGWTCWTKIYKLEILENVRFSPEAKIAEDGEFLYNVLKNAERVSIDTYSKNYHYVRRDESATGVGFNDDRKKELEIYKNLKEDMEKIIPESRKQIEAWYFKRVLYGIRLILKSDYNAEDLKNLKNEIKNMNGRWILNKYIPLKQKISYILSGG